VPAGSVRGACHGRIRDYRDPRWQAEFRYRDRVSRQVNGYNPAFASPSTGTPAVIPAETLEHAGRRFGTPLYVYLAEPIRERFRTLARAVEGRFGISYAVKANPNVGLLRAIRGLPTMLDCSSIAELERGLQAGYAAAQMSFSGPAKRPFELERAVAAGCGELVAESERELREIDAIAGRQGRRQAVLLRINPRKQPAQFGVSMAGRPSAFGIDEEVADAAVVLARTLPNLALAGLHAYSATNSLSIDAIDDNVGEMAGIFTRLARTHGFAPQSLVFGSGFGIPYQDDQSPLDLAALAPRLNARIDALRGDPLLAGARCTLEMGRWLVGPCGYLLTAVVGLKHSRGVDIALLDAGFNNHLAAAGMMGTVIRRNWSFSVLGGAARALRSYTLVGPLCTTIDQLASKIELPELRVGDRLAIAASGAYGLTASPTRFISHPEPREVLVEADGSLHEVTETRLNAPDTR
jgi:diaminopimelate decarboxylase